MDAYIEKSAPFARPILKHLRRVVHTGCPAVEEAIKWQFPHFDYNGIVDTIDFNLLAANFGKTLAAPAAGALVPEAASLSLLGLSAASLLRRRSRRS